MTGNLQKFDSGGLRFRQQCRCKKHLSEVLFCWTLAGAVWAPPHAARRRPPPSLQVVDAQRGSWLRSHRDGEKNTGSRQPCPEEEVMAARGLCSVASAPGARAGKAQRQWTTPPLTNRTGSASMRAINAPSPSCGGAGVGAVPPLLHRRSPSDQVARSGLLRARR